jgi:transcriptional regulator with XRE-family HTH domain
LTAVAELVSTPTLDELARTANREHEAAIGAVGEALAHALLAGEALLAAREMVPKDSWIEWVTENFTSGGYHTAYNYMRLAKSRTLLEEHNVAAVMEGIRLLRQLRVPAMPLLPHPDKAEGLRLRKAGKTQQEVAALLGVDQSTVSNWERTKSPESRRRASERRARAREAEKALKAQRREQAIKKALVTKGQAVNEVYRMLSRMDQLLGQARVDAETREERAAINEAHTARNKMMDAIVRALGVS